MAELKAIDWQQTKQARAFRNRVFFRAESVAGQGIFSHGNKVVEALVVPWCNQSAF
jgi:hypothetical protein